eukprot:m.129816 g.129816  ORF g.129816 m.129816 type:complete len:84 (+) comp37990_c0_seq6:1798-2049(+)
MDATRAFVLTAMLIALKKPVVLQARQMQAVLMTENATNTETISTQPTDAIPATVTTEACHVLKHFVTLFLVLKTCSSEIAATT